MATRKIEFEDAWLKTLPAADPGERYEVADTVRQGLRIRVGDERITEHSDRRRIGKAAQITFVLLARFKKGANPTRRALGTFGAITLSEARAMAFEWKELIKRGIDPADQIEADRKAAEEARQKAEEEERNRKTLSDLLDLYDDLYLKEEVTRHEATRRALDGKEGLFVGMLDRDPATITPKEILAALRRRKRVAPISANRQLAYARAFFNWCISEHLMVSNPAAGLRKPSKEVARDRCHTIDELAEVWSAAGTLGYPFGPIFQLLIVLPMRREELAQLPVNELALGPDDSPDAGVWTLPAARTKTDKALRVPLSPLARSIIKAAIEHESRPSDSPFVFTTKGDTAVSGFSKAKERLDKAVAAARKKVADKEGREPEVMPHWKLHDLRTTFATEACDTLKIEASIADRILNHVATATTSKIQRIYNRAEFFDERREALNAWANYIETSVSGAEPDNVVPFAKAKAKR